jgi:hypothetical protein
MTFGVLVTAWILGVTMAYCIVAINPRSDD